MTLRQELAAEAGLWRETFGVMIGTSLLAAGIAYLVVDHDDDDHRTAAMRSSARHYFVVHNCKVVSMERRRESLYRCETGEKTLLNVREFNKASEAFAKKRRSVP